MIKRKNISFLIIGVCFFSGWILTFFGCSQKKEENDVIAYVGPTIVSKNEFLRTYQDLMLYSNKMNSPDLRRNHAKRLVQKKLLSLAGREKGLVLDSLVMKNIQLEEDEALREKLFDYIVAQHSVDPEDSTLRKHFTWLNTEILLRHIFSKNQSFIDSVFFVVTNDTGQFISIAKKTFKDTTLAKTGGNLGWIQYNVLDPALEEVAFTLLPGEISHPIRSAYGWHILQKLDERKQVFITEDDYQREKPWLRRQVIRKRNQIKADDYVNDLMLSKHIKIDDPLFYFVANKIQSKLMQVRVEKKGILLKLNPQQTQELRVTLSDVRHLPLAEFDDGLFTVGDFLDRLELLPSRILHKDLTTGFYRSLRDVILVKEALNLNLNKEEPVKTRRKDAEDDYYASIFLAWYTGQEFHPDGHSSINSVKLQQITDSLTAIYPVTYNDVLLDTIFSHMNK